MKEKYNKIKKVFCADVYNMDKQTGVDIMKVVIIAVMITSFLATMFNYDTANWISSISALIMAFSFVLCRMLSVSYGYRKIARIFAMLVVASNFTMYAVAGYNNGFSVLWSLVVPYGTMMLLGLLCGSLVSFYLALFYFVLFWTPLHNILGCQYMEEFCRRFPILYFLCFVISFYTNYKLSEVRLYQMEEKERLKKVVVEERQKVGRITMQTIVSISNAVDAKDSYTKMHSERVAQYCKVIAEKLEWSQDEQEDLYNMALLHDIGKIGVPDAILNKEGKLNNEEYPLIQKHPVVGGEILKDLTLIHDVAKGAYYHHERYDGMGYPEGLKGEEIPLEARIIGIADAIDAMNSDRVYRSRRNVEYILQQLEEGKGTQFDPYLDELVIKLIKSGEMKLEGN